MEWIFCSDRLPQNSGRYLACKRVPQDANAVVILDFYAEVYIGVYGHNVQSSCQEIVVDRYAERPFATINNVRPAWVEIEYGYDEFLSYEMNCDEVICWMPLPEPPAERRVLE